MRDYILDVDHVAALMEGNEILLGRLHRMKADEARFGITSTILSELYFMLRSSAQMETNMAVLTGLVADLLVWEFDRGAAEIAGEVLAQQRALARPVNESEAQIAAVVRKRQAVLLTSRDNFADIRDVTVDNWLLSC